MWLKLIHVCTPLLFISFSCSNQFSIAWRNYFTIPSSEAIPKYSVQKTYLFELGYYLDFVESTRSPFRLFSSWVIEVGTLWLFPSLAILSLKSRHKWKICRTLFYLCLISIRHRVHTLANDILYDFKPCGLFRRTSWSEIMHIYKESLLLPPYWRIQL